MRDCNQRRFRQQISFLRRQFLQDNGLPFSDVLSKEIVEQALTTLRVVWNDGIYTPLVTLWVFLGQVLSADHSCRAAVSRLIAHRISRGQRACSPETSAYCQARKRLPEAFFSLVACAVGRALDDQVNPQGQRTLTSCPRHDLQQEVVAPRATAAFSRHAGLGRVLLQQRQREPIQPRHVFA